MHMLAMSNTHSTLFHYIYSDFPKQLLQALYTVVQKMRPLLHLKAIPTKLPQHTTIWQKDFAFNM